MVAAVVAVYALADDPNHLWLKPFDRASGVVFLSDNVHAIGGTRPHSLLTAGELLWVVAMGWVGGPFGEAAVNGVGGLRTL